MISRPHVEPLESRRLLSAGPDLAVTLDYGSTGLPTYLVGGSSIDWTLLVTNVGDQPATGTMRMNTTVQIPNVPPFNFVAKPIPVNLAPQASTRLPLGGDLPGVMPLGPLQFVFGVTPSLSTPDTNPANDSTEPVSVFGAVQFGNVRGRQVTGIAADFGGRQIIRASLTGGGTATLRSAVSDGGELIVDGTTDRSSLTISAPNICLLNNIQINGPLKNFTAPRVNLLPATADGDSQFVATGPIANLRLGITQYTHISLGPATGAIKSSTIIGSSAFHTDITSQVPLSINLGRFSLARLNITAPQIKSIASDDIEFVNVTTTDASAPWSIQSVKARFIHWCNFRTASSISSIEASDMIDTTVLVGVPDEVQSLPVSASQLSSGKQLSSIRIKPRRSIDAFDGCTVIAPTIGRVELSRVKSASGQPSGFSACRIKSYLRHGTGQDVKLTNLNTPGSHDTVDDYTVTTV